MKKEKPAFRIKWFSFLGGRKNNQIISRTAGINGMWTEKDLNR
jgi:hypothetical protein